MVASCLSSGFFTERSRDLLAVGFGDFCVISSGTERLVCHGAVQILICIVLPLLSLFPGLQKKVLNVWRSRQSWLTSYLRMGHFINTRYFLPKSFIHASNYLTLNRSCL